MKGMVFPNGVKPLGVIIKKTHYSLQKQQPKKVQSPQHSLDPLPNMATITSNNSSLKIPGEIKTIIKPTPAQIDEQVYYNADIYDNLQKSKEKISYESVQHLRIPLKIRSKSVKNETSYQSDTNLGNQPLESIQEQNANLINTHREFQLQKYKLIASLFRNMTVSYNQNQVQFLNSVRTYMQLITTANISEPNILKMVPNKRQIIRHSFISERQAIIVICLTVATRQTQKCKNYCTNLLKYIYDNYLVTLNLLTHQSSPFVLKLLAQEDRQFLIGKGFQLLRTNKDIIADLIYKILKIDPLFAVEYYKILQSCGGMEVKYVSNALLTLFAFYINAIKAHQIISFMACGPGPFITQPPAQEYTLVIDFLKVFLAHQKPSKKQRKSKEVLSVRPYSTYFIKQMSKYYQIVSFSNSMPIQCNSVINTIDGNGCVKHRLYRYHCDVNGRKDAGRVGRDLNKMIILDTLEDESNKSLLLVSGWKGEESNVQLAEICPLLALIVVKKLDAVVSLQKIREARRNNGGLGLKYINCGLSL